MLAEFVANIAINMVNGCNSFYINNDYQSLVPSIVMHNRGLLCKVKAVQIRIDPMKITLEEA